VLYSNANLDTWPSSYLYLANMIKKKPVKCSPQIGEKKKRVLTILIIIAHKLA